MAIHNHLIWIGSIVPEDIYEHLCSIGYKNQQASRIAQLNIIKGLEAHYGIYFDYISGPSLPPFPVFPKLLTTAFSWETSFGGRGISPSYLNIPYINRLLKGNALVRNIKKFTESFDKNDSLTAYIYCPHSPFIRAGIEIKKLFPQAKLVFVIPDLPQFMELNVKPIKRILKRIDIFYIRRQLKYFDYYVPFSKHMISYLNLDEAKCVVMEGCVSDELKHYDKNISEYDKPFTFMYSGKADIRFGLKLLIDAFEQVNDDNISLIITGEGDAAEYIKAAENRDKRIHYYGFISDYSRVKQMQVDADILLNMRLPSEEASMYCFPSKLFEYMQTGNPVISFKIGGIKDEYYDYLITVENESVDALKEAIINARKMTDQERKKMGDKSKAFILENKNIISQTNKIFKLVSN